MEIGEWNWMKLSIRRHRFDLDTMPIEELIERAVDSDTGNGDHHRLGLWDLHIIN
jgi:hypothetical protein